MGPLPGRWVCLCVRTACEVLLCGAAAHSESPEASGSSPGESTARLHVAGTGAEWPLRQAVDGAHLWLGHTACQRVFSDFTDLSGRLLSDVLAERGLTGQDQLDRLSFYDGSR